MAARYFRTRYRSSKEMLREAKGKMTVKNFGQLGDVSTTAQRAYPSHLMVNRTQPVGNRTLNSVSASSFLWEEGGGKWIEVDEGLRML